MLICNYNKIFELYTSIINFYSNKINNNSKDDCYQDISLYIFRHIGGFDPSKSSFKYFFFLMARTGFRRFVYDKKSQEKFEDTFCRQEEWIDVSYGVSNDNITAEILKYLNGIEKSVFFAVFYNKWNSNYLEISKMMNMSYPIFLSHVRKIREIINKVTEN